MALLAKGLALTWHDPHAHGAAARARAACASMKACSFDEDEAD
jgi:hypothetical protein